MIATAVRVETDAGHRGRGGVERRPVSKEEIRIRKDADDTKVRRKRHIEEHEVGSDATKEAKQRAEQLGVDLSEVQGSGPGGFIGVKDVESAVSNFEASKPKITSEKGSAKFEGIEDRFAGYSVYDSNYEKIGKVNDLFVDESDQPE